MKTKGFTLIELLVVLAIIGILATIAVPAYFNIKTKVVHAEAKLKIAELTRKEIQFYHEKQEWDSNKIEVTEHYQFRVHNFSNHENKNGRTVIAIPLGNYNGYMKKIWVDDQMVRESGICEGEPGQVYFMKSKLDCP